MSYYYTEAPKVYIIEEKENLAKIQARIEDVFEGIREKHDHQDIPNPFSDGYKDGLAVVIGTTAATIRVTPGSTATGLSSDRENKAGYQDHIIFINTDPNVNVSKIKDKFNPANFKQVLKWKSEQDKLKVTFRYGKINAKKFYKQKV